MKGGNKKMIRYKVGLENLVPIYGLKKFIDENPTPEGDNIEENKRYVSIALPLALYNLACIVGAGVGVAGAIYKGIETILQ
jgi:hypothetical protein